MSDPLRAQLLDKVAEVANLLSPAQAEALALELSKSIAAKRIRTIGGLPAPQEVRDVCDLWTGVSVEGPLLADALRTASRAVHIRSSVERVELVYTGPGADPIRRTAQALLQVIRSARRRLWLCSYAVSTGVEPVLDALRERTEAGVHVSVLLDHRINHFDHTLHRFGGGAPKAKIFVWPDDSRELGPEKWASLHAKCAIADGHQSFVTSANLTGHAMEHNLEVGYLVTGGPTPQTLMEYFDGLVAAGEIVEVDR